MKKSNSHLQSKTVRGTLWIVAALPMLLAPILFAGNPAIVAIGVLFLVIGLATLKR
jgi:hypothetical protein